MGSKDCRQTQWDVVTHLREVFFLIRKHKVRKVPLGRMGNKKVSFVMPGKKRRVRAVGGKGSEMQVV